MIPACSPNTCTFLVHSYYLVFRLVRHWNSTPSATAALTRAGTLPQSMSQWEENAEQGFRLSESAVGVKSICKLYAVGDTAATCDQTRNRRRVLDNVKMANSPVEVPGCTVRHVKSTSAVLSGTGACLIRTFVRISQRRSGTLSAPLRFTGRVKESAGWPYGELRQTESTRLDLQNPLGHHEHGCAHVMCWDK